MMELSKNFGKMFQLKVESLTSSAALKCRLSCLRGPWSADGKRSVSGLHNPSLPASQPEARLPVAGTPASAALSVCVVWSGRTARPALIFTSFIMSTHSPAAQGPFPPGLPPETRIWLLLCFSINMILKSHFFKCSNQKCILSFEEAS